MIPLFRVFMSEEAVEDVAGTLRSGFITQGKKVQEFEAALQKYLDFEFGVTVNSATSGLMLALRLAGVEPGDKVISTPMTCSATNEAIALMGADIVWADVNEYGNIDPKSVTSRLQDTGAAAIVAVDWGGLPCDYEALRMYGLPIIEDAAHAFGATYHGKSISQSGGDFVVYSFQAIKHLTTGDGGLVTMHNEIAYERGKLLRWYGLDREGSDSMRSRQDIRELGWKFHMNDIAATLGLANLKEMGWVLERHRKNAAFYDKNLQEFRPDWPRDRESSSWVYTIQVRDPIGFETYAKENGFGASQVHRRNDEYSIFEKYRNDDLPGLDRFAAGMVCIPCGWWVTAADQLRIIEAVWDWQNLDSSPRA